MVLILWNVSRGESFWQKGSLITHILFEVWLIMIFSPVANFAQQSLCYTKSVREELKAFCFVSVSVFCSSHIGLCIMNWKQSRTESSFISVSFLFHFCFVFVSQNRKLKPKWNQAWLPNFLWISLDSLTDIMTSELIHRTSGQYETIINKFTKSQLIFN
mgnify:CR=1 FL=1